MSERKMRSKLAVIQRMIADKQAVEEELVGLARRRKELLKRRRELEAGIALAAGGKADAYFTALEESPNTPAIAGRIGAA